ncbi:MAG: glycosyltransferase family 2 protein, partial [Alphaproteobacteria bacterium]
MVNPVPFISLVIPVYKVEKYLPACLDSVLAQTFQEWEAICVNDGSPDGCGKILAEYGQKDKRFKIITQQNQGVSVARNEALEQAVGRYICFLDSDDELAPAFLEKMLTALKENQADIVSCEIQQGEDKKEWRELTSSFQVYQNPFEAYMQGQLKTYAAIWGKLYKKETLKGLDFKTEISQGGEDILYLYQAFYQAKKLIRLQEKLYFYRARPGSVMSSKLSERFVLGNIKTAELLSDYFESKELSPKTRKILNQKVAKRIFKFAVLEPKRKDKEN